MTVSGAYGRDYKSAKEMRADWNAGKDFVIRSVDGLMGSYISKNSGYPATIMGRYKNDREICKLQ